MMALAFAASRKRCEVEYDWHCLTKPFSLSD